MTTDCGQQVPFITRRLTFDLRIHALSIYILLFLCLSTFILAFAPKRIALAPFRGQPLLLPPLFSSFGQDDVEIARLLKERKEQLDLQNAGLVHNWKTARCESRLAVALTADWVRRIALSYPLVAAGSASDTIYVAHIETGTILAQSTSPSHNNNDDDHEEETEDDEELTTTNAKSILRMLYGPYDGGGTIAIAMHGDLIVSAGRHRRGSVQIYRYDATNNNNNNNNSKTLLFQGSMQALDGVLVTCLQLDDDYLWIGTADGRVVAFEHSSSSSPHQQQPLALQTHPAMTLSVGSSSPVLALSIDSTMGLGVFATARGSVELFSTEQEHSPNSHILASWYPPFDGSSCSDGSSTSSSSRRRRRSANTYPLAVALIPAAAGDEEITTRGGGGSSSNYGYYMACGGSDGSLYLQGLNVQQQQHDGAGNCDAELDILHPLVGDVVECLPRHQAAIMCLTSPKPGLLVSGGQDGTIRMWNIDDDGNGGSKCQYQFMGYKVWLGSLCTDGIRLVSDGADNTIVVHNFEWKEDDARQSK